MSNPTCSHCDYELNEEETWHEQEIHSDDGELSEITCPNFTCQKTFYVMCKHDIRWESCDEYGDDI